MVPRLATEQAATHFDAKLDVDKKDTQENTPRAISSKEKGGRRITPMLK